jgi:hypothetical protein
VATLDPNLVTTQGSILAAFGVAVTLLLSKAEGYRRDYLTSGKQADFDEARRWYAIVITVPIAVLVFLAMLSWLGAHHAGLTLIRHPSEDTVLLIAPVLAQLGFIAMVLYVLPKTPGIWTNQLLPATEKLPASSFSATPTKLCVKNESHFTLDICWINQLGKAELPDSPRSSQVSSGQSSPFRNTFAGHTWLVSAANTPIGVVVAAELSSCVTVSASVVDQALSLPEPGAWTAVPKPLIPSPTTVRRSVIYIDNRSQEVVTIEWVDYSGHPSQRQTRRPGELFVSHTTEGHHFLVSGADGTRIGMATAEISPSLFVVTTELLEQAQAERTSHP